MFRGKLTWCKGIPGIVEDAGRLCRVLESVFSARNSSTARHLCLLDFVILPANMMTCVFFRLPKTDTDSGEFELWNLVNLIIRPNSAVRRIVFKGARATGAVVASGGQTFELESEEIVLCSGAVGSPHQLLLSGGGPADQLQEVGIPALVDLPGVGKNLRDHPELYVSWRTKEGFEQNVRDPRVQVSLRNTALNLDLRNDMIIIKFWTRPISNSDSPSEDSGVSMLVMLALARSAGELKLITADPDVQPSIDFRFLEHTFDRERCSESVRKCIEFAEHEAFSDILAERTDPSDRGLDSDDALDEWMMRKVTTGMHMVRTFKMGPSSDPMDVVNQYGSFHGIEGLRVADASIMPDCIRANTNVTTMMIGERVADFNRKGL